jgi:hypothetical protein
MLIKFILINNTIYKVFSGAKIEGRGVSFYRGRVKSKGLAGVLAPSSQCSILIKTLLAGEAGDQEPK